MQTPPGGAVAMGCRETQKERASCAASFPSVCLTRCAALLLTLPALVFAGDASALAWPARVGPAEAHSTTGVIVPVDAPHGLGPIHTFAGVRPSAADRQAARTLVNDREVELRFEGPGAFVYSPVTQPLPRTRGRAAAPRHDLAFKFVSGREIEAGAVVEISRTWFAWYDPTTEDEQAPRGTVLLMPGMLGTPEPTIEFFITRFQASGYAVLRMMCQPSRFTERITFDVDLDDPAPAIFAIAETTSERLSECAYAVEAAFAHVDEQRPDFAELPRIALGMSGGAIILPTVLAREPDRYAAAILIAGGANLMSILELSNYREMINAADIRWRRGPGSQPVSPALGPDTASAPHDPNPVEEVHPTPSERSRIEHLYLKHATLDPYHTAAHLRGRPVLMIHGSHDLAVPAELGDLLWERLGRPERWIEEAGHEVLFIRLPQKMGDLLEWLDGNLPD